VEKAGKQYLVQVIKVNIISDVTLMTRCDERHFTSVGFLLKNLQSETGGVIRKYHT
jgi:hypothetical protein